MFTGIIETIGTVTALRSESNNLHITIQSAISAELKIDQSVSHNGVCLTVVSIDGNTHTVTAIQETLLKTNFRNLSVGSIVNLERCTPANGRFDGHIVQGHVDQTAECISVNDVGGSWVYTFRYQPGFASMIVEKGSICVNGISLTAFDVKQNLFSIAIIPYTYEHTNIKTVAPTSQVNLEFDIVGKYIAKLMETKK